MLFKYKIFQTDKSDKSDKKSKDKELDKNSIFIKRDSIQLKDKYKDKKFIKSESIGSKSSNDDKNQLEQLEEIFKKKQKRLLKQNLAI